MILYVEKFHAIEFQWLVMVLFGNTNSPHGIMRNLGDFLNYSNTDIGCPL